MSAIETPAAMQYLTVQDMLWINLQLTKQSNDFNFATLEEATFCQYGYGGSQDVLGQAGKFLKGFIAKAPFSGKADDMTAFIGTVAFLAMNGYALDVPAAEVSSWIERVKSGQIDVAQAIPQLAKATHGHHAPSAIEAMKAALAQYI